MPSFKYSYEHSTATGSGSIEADNEDDAKNIIEKSLIDATTVMGDGEDKNGSRKVDASATKEAKIEVKKSLKIELEQITE